jgi:hypothetical protein
MALKDGRNSEEFMDRRDCEEIDENCVDDGVSVKAVP